MHFLPRITRRKKTLKYIHTHTYIYIGTIINVYIYTVNSPANRVWCTYNIISYNVTPNRRETMVTKFKGQVLKLVFELKFSQIGVQLLSLKHTHTHTHT